MASLPRYQQDIIDNPIQRAERLHLLRGDLSRFWKGVYAITIFTIVAPILWGFTVHFHGTLEFALVMLLCLNGVMIFAVEMRIMNHASDSIKREFQGRTWDLLILTGVDTWRLILGKWIGAIRGNRREIVFLYALRISTLFWAMVSIYLKEDGFHRWDHYWKNEPPVIAYMQNIRFDPQALMVGVIIMAVFLALEIMLVASLPMALSLFKTTRKGATWIALGLRIGIPFALGMFTIWFTRELEPVLGTVVREYSSRTYFYYSPEVEAGIYGIATVLSDNGLAWTLLNMDKNYSSIYFAPNAFYLAQLMGIGLYLLWIWIMLRVAKYGASRYNVSTPGFVPKGKPKRFIKAEQSTIVASTATSIPQPKRRSPQTTNLLGIQNPALYRCEVVRYEASELDILVYRTTKTTPGYKIRFKGVSFFTGAMNWTNAKFEQIEDKYLRQYANNQKLDAHKLPVGSKLYVVKSQGNRTRIIATDVQIEVVKQIPSGKR